MRKNKGITLIALVITIIVLLILAGVSIATLLGENGILNQAEKARVETRGATVEEECNLWKINKGIDSQTAQETSQTLEGLLDSLEERNLITAEERATIKETGEITIGGRTINFGKEEPPTEKPGNPDPVTGLFTVSSTIDGKNKGTSTNPIIPEGFKPVDEGEAKWGNEKNGPTEEAVDEGLVIEDKDENQFVWVPVKNFNEFKREDFRQRIAQDKFVTDTATDGLYYEPKGDGETIDERASTTEKEAQEMYKSVKDNGGFYIGRYEAGTTDTNTSNTGIRGDMVCKKGATVYGNIGWSNVNDMITETGGAVQVAREFATQQKYTSVKSTLCYGVQWDAVMRWMKDVENPNATNEDETYKKYIEDSTGMGWDKDNYTENSEHKTGIDIGSGENNKSNKVKNIYDMSGNACEWTMEASSTTSRVYRGGHYGFRPALYLYR